MGGNLRARLTAIERAHSGDAAECGCAGQGPHTGTRVTYLAAADDDAEWQRELDAKSDKVTTCAKCGRLRPLVVIEYVNDWRAACE